jgi:glycosyltransferase involved in cell wall biosynthesis
VKYSLYAGKIDPVRRDVWNKRSEQGFHLLAEALREVAGRGWRDTAEVVVFGSSEPAQPQDFGLKARYFGWLSDDIGLALLYSAADVLVAPSMQENLPYTVMESMACGTPCVAFDQGGVPDLIDHEHTGYLARPYEPASLAHGILWVLGDENRRRELSSRARQKAEHEFSLEKIANKYAELYREIRQ